MLQRLAFPTSPCQGYRESPVFCEEKKPDDGVSSCGAGRHHSVIRHVPLHPLTNAPLDLLAMLAPLLAPRPAVGRTEISHRWLFCPAPAKLLGAIGVEGGPPGGRCAAEPSAAKHILTLQKNERVDPNRHSLSVAFERPCHFYIPDMTDPVFSRLWNSGELRWIDEGNGST
jgi:hypothetical protein